MDEQKQPSNMNKNYTYTAIGIIVLIIIAWAIYASNHKDSDDTTKNNNGQQQTSTMPENNTATSTAQTSTTSPVTKPAAKLSYSDAIKAYPYRFQFSQCHGNPGTLAVKKLSIVMLDNRDAVAHTVKADNQTFKIAKYDYALLHTNALTGTNVNVTCDGGGAAILNVEK